MSGEPVMKHGDAAYPVMDEIQCVHCYCSASIVQELAWDDDGCSIEDPVCCEIPLSAREAGGD